MAFTVSEKTLERLQWPELVARLRELAQTPQGREHLHPERPGLFAGGSGELRERLAETSEARTLLDRGEFPPLGGARELEGPLARLERGGGVGARDLLDLASTLRTLTALARHLAAREEAAPVLADRAAAIGDHRPLADAIEAALDPEGEVRDEASRELAQARAEARGLSGEIQRRIGRYLKDADVTPALSDSFFTVRNDRYVLPVRSDARAKVPGIVHDASASGTTLFVEPQALVDLNNRLKQAELRILRETRRVLRALAERVRAELPDLRVGLELLGHLDAAFARGRLSLEQAAVEPEVGDEGVFVLPQLRHPLLPPDEVVPNDLRLGEGFSVLVISGPNAGGKTVALKALALAALCVRAGLHVPAGAGARVDRVDAVLADIGDEQDLRASLSTFSAHVANLAAIVRDAGSHSLVALDEVGVGTDPAEGAALAQSVLETLADSGARVIATTHYNLLKEMAEVDGRFANASVDFDPETLAPSYRLRLGAAGASSATAVAARMGMPRTVLDRTHALLEREDRRLDRMLTELQTSRASLEREAAEARRLRQESEAARDVYRHKLERLQERRDKLFEEMRRDLDRAFGAAHSEVAAVIRDLQRRGTAQDAARARERLIALEERSEQVESRVQARTRPPDAAPRRRALDWPRTRLGDAVTVPGGRQGTLLTLPDRRGRVSVQVGANKLSLAADQLEAAAPGRDAEARPAARVSMDRDALDAPRSEAPGGRCDLRGLRVDEALERLAAALDESAARGAARLEIVHGVGTGALRKAVRAHLRESSYVVEIESGDPERGGDGVTIACLQD